MVKRFGYKEELITHRKHKILWILLFDINIFIPVLLQWWWYSDSKRSVLFLQKATNKDYSLIKLEKNKLKFAYVEIKLVLKFEFDIVLTQINLCNYKD